MTISAEWDDEGQTVLMITFKPGWTLGELEGTLQRGLDLSKDLDHPFYGIGDMRAAPKMPSGHAISQLRSAAQQSPPNIRCLYIVGSDLFFISLLSVMQRIIPMTARMWRVVPTMAAAYALIEADKRSLLAAQAPSRSS
jgi:hypothetical protein